MSIKGKVFRAHHQGKEWKLVPSISCLFDGDGPSKSQEALGTILEGVRVSHCTSLLPKFL